MPLRARRAWLATAALGALGLGYVGGNLHPPDALVVQTHTLSTPLWSGPPVRVALLADLHLSSEDDLERLAVIGQQVRAQRPDLVLLAGDYAGDPAFLRRQGHHVLVDALAETLAPVAPTLAVLGNHDNWHSPEDWRRAFAASPIKLVEGAVVEVDVPGGVVCVRGLGDAFSGAWAPVAIPDHCAGHTLTLTHDPSGLLHEGTLETIGLAGHTHCGEVRLPLIGAPWTPTDAPFDMHCGPFERIYPGLTSGGLGTSIAPVRFGLGTAPRWELLTVRTS